MNRKISFILELLIGISLAVILMFILNLYLHKKTSPSYRLICGSALSGLRKAMLLYAHDNDYKYPTADKWCDLLMMHIDAKHFICRGSDATIGESSYAFNKNLEGKKSSETPPDMVLLFETKGGWNQYGGPELLTFENHKGEGCNVLFNSFNVSFVKPEKVSELNWGENQNQ
jgi:hypothetical protein